MTEKEMVAEQLTEQKAAHIFQFQRLLTTGGWKGRYSSDIFSGFVTALSSVLQIYISGVHLGDTRLASPRALALSHNYTCQSSQRKLFEPLET